MVSGTAFGQDVIHSVFLPVISNGDAAPTSAPFTYELNQKELEVQQLFLSDPGQQHPELHFNELLAQQARQKAKDMATRRYVDHVTPDGVGPNYLVRQAGYQLPASYDQDAAANNIESLAAGFATAPAVWAALLASTSHRVHLLGEYDFYKDQVEYGVGYYYDRSAPYRHYWVILIAKPGNQNSE